MISLVQVIILSFISLSSTFMPTLPLSEQTIDMVISEHLQLIPALSQYFQQSWDPPLTIYNIRLWQLCIKSKNIRLLRAISFCK
ncbi:hypothetical protein FGO68_gene5158 [Halteria grandinella]|uniref:Secreted protein n=1 Tax=Halteria grandinella TaxID=5974 RepID=A0A8J8SVH0_HALGN|nr:hypothetical protein FGO68_gene5158 [Halteria grandinella]